jgi:hypothetical protein
MNAQKAYMLHFGHSIYAQNAKKTTFPIYLVTCPKLSIISRNHRNNVLTIATSITDVIGTHCYYDNSSKRHCSARSYCTFTGLVPPHSPKLELGYIKIEARKAVLNLVTCHTLVSKNETKVSICVPRMFKSYVYQQYNKQMKCFD